MPTKIRCEYTGFFEIESSKIKLIDPTDLSGKSVRTAEEWIEDRKNLDGLEFVDIEKIFAKCDDGRLVITNVAIKPIGFSVAYKQIESKQPTKQPTPETHTPNPPLDPDMYGHKKIDRRSPTTALSSMELSELIESMINNGMNQTQIAIELKLNSSTISLTLSLVAVKRHYESIIFSDKDSALKSLCETAINEFDKKTRYKQKSSGFIGITQAKDLLRYITSHDMTRNEKIKFLCILCGVDENGNIDSYKSMNAKEFRAFLQDQDDRYILRTNRT